MPCLEVVNYDNGSEGTIVNEHTSYSCNIKAWI